MLLLFDTNVVLDVLAAREPFVRDSALMMALVEQGQVKGCLCATTLTTLFYLLRRAAGAEQARKHVGVLLKLFEVVPVNRAVIDDALRLPFADFEDAVLHEAARQAGCHAIITRNVEDFRRALLKVHTPEQYLLMHRMSLHEKAGVYVA